MVQKRSPKELTSAFEAYEAGQYERARRWLDSLTLRELSLPDRFRAQTLLEELREWGSNPPSAEKDDREAEPADLPRALVYARRQAEENEDEEEKERWRERFLELRERITSEWLLEISTEETTLEDGLRTSFYYQRYHLWLDDPGRRLLLVNSMDGWLFIRVVDVVRERIVARVSLKPAEPLVRPLVTCLDGEELRVGGARGGVVALSIRDWKVSGWYPTHELAPRDYTVEGVVPLPGKGYAWMEVRWPDDEPETFVIDLVSWKVERKLPGGLVTILPLSGPEECRVLYSSDDVGTRLYHQDGTFEGAEQLFECGVSSVAASPDGRGTLFLIGRSTWKAEKGELAPDAPEIKNRVKDTGDVLVLIEESPGGGSRVIAELDVGERMALGDHRLATSLEDGLAYVLLTRSGSRADILAIELVRREDGTSGAPSAELALRYQVTLPYGTMLVQDRCARRVLALVFSNDAMEIVPLGRKPPEFTLPPEKSGKAERDPHLPNVLNNLLCGEPTGAVHRGLEELEGTFRKAGSSDLEELVEQLKDVTDEAELEHLVYLCMAARKTAYMARDALSDYVKSLVRRFPTHPGIALIAAEAEAQAENWPVVRQILGELEPEGLDDGRARHLCHLKGLGFLHGREPEKAFAAFTAAEAYPEGNCDLRALLLLTRPMADPPGADEWGRDQPLVRQVLGMVRTADRWLEQGDFESVRALLEDPYRWRISEQQLTARLAASYLETEVSSPTERFYKRLALARFCFLRSLDARFFRKELSLPGLSWDVPRLDELEKRVRAWLDGE